MPQIVFQEFRDSTKSTKYPFTDCATLVDLDEKIRLPNDLFIDLSLYKPGILVSPYLFSIEVRRDYVYIIFSAGGGIGAHIDITSTAEDKDVVIPLYSANTSEDAMSRTGTILDAIDKKPIRSGTLVMNGLKLSYFRSLPLGKYMFSNNATEIVPSCYITMPNVGLTSVSINERKEEYTLSGDVWLVGHNGVFLRKEGDRKIRIDVVGDPLYKDAAISIANENDGTMNSYTVPKPVRTINGKKPDVYGNFTITTDTVYDALRVQNNKDGITIFLAGATNGN